MATIPLQDLRPPAATLLTMQVETAGSEPLEGHLDWRSPFGPGSMLQMLLQCSARGSPPFTPKRHYSFKLTTPRQDYAFAL